jgi:hypothetical protein
MKVTVINADINGKKYTVERVFNMVLNYEFTDDKGTTYLVDGEDIATWSEEEKGVGYNDIQTAIEYANYYAKETEDGVFWWKVK